MNYMSGTTIPDIIFAVHKCAKHSIDPKQLHEEAIKRIGRLFKENKIYGFIFYNQCIKWA